MRALSKEGAILFTDDILFRYPGLKGGKLWKEHHDRLLLRALLKYNLFPLSSTRANIKSHYLKKNKDNADSIVSYNVEGIDGCCVKGGSMRIKLFGGRNIVKLWPLMLLFGKFISMAN